jgi:hypothetical protein
MDILDLEHVQLLRRKTEQEAAPGEVIARADVDLSGEEVAEVIVDGRVVLHIEFGREAQAPPMLHKPRCIVRQVGNDNERTVLEDFQVRSKLSERAVVLHPEHGERSVVDGVQRRVGEHGTHHLAKRMSEERPELGMHHRVDAVGPVLLPRLVESLAAEGPVPLLDTLGRRMEFADERGSFVRCSWRGVFRGRQVLLNAPEGPSATVTR